jgi:lipopolysaccharide export system protein LptC
MKSRLLILVIILGFAAIAIGWIYESSLRPGEKQSNLQFPDDIDYFFTDMHYRELNDDGVLDFEILTPRLEHYPHNDVSSLETPSIQIHDPSSPWKIDAMQGEFRHSNNLLQLNRQVVMHKEGPSPMEVYTESISFEPDRDLVSTDVEILIISPQARIRADRAEFDLARKIYRFDRTRSVYRQENNHEDS